ncbi:hypothetical protein [Frateuria defendens]|uniref:hypothetical protein n=1 Tax=Frateuria defendens TaxID=2219559 RepID=UPI00066FCA53|nr:hypothetical protein [Frateuria defendens]
MNEFEWRRPLQDLRRPVSPRPELWTRIDAALDTPRAAAAPARASRRQAWLAAAGFAGLSLLAVGLGLLQPRHGAELASSAPGAGHRPWKPDDPRLAGAAVELDAARMELQQALRHSPDAAVLQRLLERTDRQQSQLRRLDQAG